MSAENQKAGHQSLELDVSLNSDVRPFGDSLGLIQATDPLLGTSVLLQQKLLTVLNLKDGLDLETRYDKSI